MAAPLAIIFDMDGVLFLTNSAHDRAYRQVLGELGVEAEFSYPKVAGMKTVEAFAKILSKQSKVKATDEKIQQCAEQKTQIAFSILREAPPVAEGCREVLEKLSKRYKLALASSSRARNVQLFLDSSGTAKYFSVVLNGEDVKLAKPDPEIYLKALARLQMLPAVTRVVEDAPNGVLSAINAGMRVIGLTGTCSEAELKKSGAELVIGNLCDLAAALEKQDE